jgi:hypothetical protein
MNYEIVRQAKSISKPVSSVLYSSTPHRPQTDLGCRGSSAREKPPSNQVSTKLTHYALKISCLYISEVTNFKAA